MQKVTSKDGTAIAFERFGDGPPVVVVGGAFCDRSVGVELAGMLSDRFTGVTYDRRGRGDSGDTLPYEVDREIEDLAAVIEAVGGSAQVYGISSGSALSALAAAAGLPIVRLTLFEPPYRVPGAPPAPERYLDTLVELTSSGRLDDAVEYFMVAAVGQPPEQVAQMRATPMWAPLAAMAPTLVYDAHVMGDSAVPTALGSLTTPTLVVHSNGSPAWLRDAAAATAKALPNAELRGLDGDFHQVPTESIAATF
jgi:pimeloyl-ACP methyl ester carboxylesterase